MLEGGKKKPREQSRGFFDCNEAMQIYREIIQQIDLGRHIVLATLVKRERGVARSVGSKMLITDQGKITGSLGGGLLEATVIKRAGDIFQTGEPVLLTLEPEQQCGDVCGSSVQVFLEPVPPGPSVLIIGAGHVGRAVAAVAVLTGFQVQLADDRCPEDTGVEHICCAKEDFFAGLSVGEHTFIIICTRSHALDFVVLEQALTTSANYVGLLGSRKKRDSFFTRLQQNGVFASDLARIVTPVGIEIGAKTPQEIAVSIVAQLIARHRE